MEAYEMTMNNKTCTEIPTELEGPSGNMNRCECVYNYYYRFVTILNIFHFGLNINWYTVLFSAPVDSYDLHVQLYDIFITNIALIIILSLEVFYVQVCIAPLVEYTLEHWSWGKKLVLFSTESQYSK